MEVEIVKGDSPGQQAVYHFDADRLTPQERGELDDVLTRIQEGKAAVLALPVWVTVELR